MVNAKEIRIGNIIRVTFSEEETGFGKDYDGIVEAIQKNKVLIKGDLHWQPIDAMQPIPLSPEVLEMCGLKQDMESAKYNYMDWTSNELVVRIEQDGFLIRFGDIVCLRFDSNFYLHILQNLHYFLTGHELEYKP